MRGLEGKVAFVTGAGRGIGEAIAKRLAAEGAKVAVADVLEDNARQTARVIGAAAIAVVVDITNSAAVRAAVADCEKRLGPIEVLVNNAGWDKIEAFIASSEETWDKVIAINLKGPIICIRAVLDGMIARGRGHIVSIGSDAGRVGSSGEAVYSAAKSGIIGFSKTLAREVARYHVNVNVVCPGPTKTPLLQQLQGVNPKLMDSLVRAVPFRRLAEPDEIAAAVAFLASDDAAFITGQTLSVSGGLTMT